MKKHVLLAMSVIMVLGSIKAMAMSDEDIMNQQTKIDAMVMNQRIANQNESFVDQDSKIQAVQKMDILRINREVERVLTLLETEGPMGSLQATGIGQLSDIAQRNLDMSDISENSDEINSLWLSSQEVERDLIQIKKAFNLK